jgi:hypothetical protein
LTTCSVLQAAKQAEARRKEQAEREAARKAKEEAAKANGEEAPQEEKKEEEKKKKEDDDDDDDDDSKGAKPIGNGGVTDKYSWTQTLSELQVVISAEQLGLAGVSMKGKMLDIDIKKKALKIGVKGKEPLIDGELHQQVKLENSMWTIGELPCVNIHRLFHTQGS